MCLPTLIRKLHFRCEQGPKGDLATLNGFEDDVAVSWQLRSCQSSGDPASAVRVPCHELSGGDYLCDASFSGDAAVDAVISSSGAAPGDLPFPACAWKTRHDPLYHPGQGRSEPDSVSNEVVAIDWSAGDQPKVRLRLASHALCPWRLRKIDIWVS
ncbi:hypothetical protein PG996_012277 [Apiospora saccharicola]|uniref:Ig-like domain-containing protein n=1 Tax=Apiospora saccharicola TaxID=335842 RepID=A0ABR1U247_9PEZI